MSKFYKSFLYSLFQKVRPLFQRKKTAYKTGLAFNKNNHWQHLLRKEIKKRKQKIRLQDQLNKLGYKDRQTKYLFSTGSRSEFQFQTVSTVCSVTNQFIWNKDWKGDCSLVSIPLEGVERFT